MGKRRRVRLICIVVGALGGALLPFVSERLPTSGSPGASPYHVALSVLVNAAFGALVGWSLGALVEDFLGDRR